MPVAERLGKNSLDDLISFKTHELQNRAKALLLRLREVCAVRADLEARLDAKVRRLLEKRIEQRNREIESHDAGKPPEVKPPGGDPASDSAAKAKLDTVAARKAEREAAAAALGKAEQTAASERIRAARARKLLDKLTNLEESIKEQVADLDPEQTQLDLAGTDMITYEIHRAPVEAVHKQARENATSATEALRAPLPDGLRERLKAASQALSTAQRELDRPNQEHQAYLAALAAWEEVHAQLVGDADDPDSLRGLQAELEALNKVPKKINVVKRSQAGIAARIHELLCSEANVYRTGYRPVQTFIDSHELAKGQLRLEFKVDLVEEGFVDGLLERLNQSRKGSFHGLAEGREFARSLTETVDWSSGEAVAEFLSRIEITLHRDVGVKDATRALKDQVRKGTTVADLVAWLYGLTYLKPRYLLRWEGKDVGQLSPGERGTLLLIFYLLIDESDMPLIMDQPEANLDNLTVAQKLVNCIRLASDRRQVIIVTHNPNLAVVCDAEQIIHASLNKLDGNRITYTLGALENPLMNQFALDVLEGSRPAFNKRGDAYQVGAH